MMIPKTIRNVFLLGTVGLMAGGLAGFSARSIARPASSSAMLLNAHDQRLTGRESRSGNAPGVAYDYVSGTVNVSSSPVLVAQVQLSDPHRRAILINAGLDLGTLGAAILGCYAALSTPGGAVQIGNPIESEADGPLNLSVATPVPSTGNMFHTIGLYCQSSGSTSPAFNINLVASLVP